MQMWKHRVTEDTEIRTNDLCALRASVFQLDRLHYCLAEKMN